MKRIQDMQICISGEGYRHQMLDAWRWCGSRPHVANVPNKTMSALCCAGYTTDIRNKYFAKIAFVECFWVLAKREVKDVHWTLSSWESFRLLSTKRVEVVSWVCRLASKTKTTITITTTATTTTTTTKTETKRKTMESLRLLVEKR